MCPPFVVHYVEANQRHSQSVECSRKKFLYKGRNTGGHYSLDDLV